MTRDEFYSIVGRDVVAHFASVTRTPAFLYFEKLLRKRYADLKGCLPSSFEIYYAVKANPNPDILKMFASLGVGADVTSLGELMNAVARGITPDHIEFSGPGKSEEEIVEAIRKGVGSINAESLPELESIARISGDLGIKARVGVRINPRSSSSEIGLRMSGDTQFGIPFGQIPEALRFIRGNDGIIFTGVHVHSGSQILSSAALIQNLRMILDLSLEIDGMDILPIGKINFGGGWGIRYFPNQTNLELKQLTEGLKELFNEARYSQLLRVRHIVEPGRFLVGECGLYVTRVLYQKQGVRKNFLIVDGGMHQHYLLAGGMGQVIRRNFEIDIIATDSKRKPGAVTYDIAGCLCTPQDILADNFQYNTEIHSGDRIVFFNSGAYGLTASPTNFLGHRPPAEIIC